jgi:hypothetical protein
MALIFIPCTAPQPATFAPDIAVIEVVFPVVTVPAGEQPAFAAMKIPSRTTIWTAIVAVAELDSRGL